MLKLDFKLTNEGYFEKYYRLEDDTDPILLLDRVDISTVINWVKKQEYINLPESSNYWKLFKYKGNFYFSKYEPFDRLYLIHVPDVNKFLFSMKEGIKESATKEILAQAERVAAASKALEEIKEKFNL